MTSWIRTLTVGTWLLVACVSAGRRHPRGGTAISDIPEVRTADR